ncbi:hypothetical protein FNU76_19625 [Chitinimonas arctica]|uniref:Uncharacterized protein n=1 Tax=Chitinimonas arctica TaxID=2594795 RepID=A0A516SJR7_9NEIS|nr:hypothetical protein [Chitinimonas arctica]QDQ28384.1 hypothetical protein FNU76_19625 [Chitinimonas arctica]
MSPQGTETGSQHVGVFVGGGASLVGLACGAEKQNPPSRLDRFASNLKKKWEESVPGLSRASAPKVERRVELFAPGDNGQAALGEPRKDKSEEDLAARVERDSLALEKYQFAEELSGPGHLNDLLRLKRDKWVEEGKAGAYLVRHIDKNKTPGFRVMVLKVTYTPYVPIEGLAGNANATMTDRLLSEWQSFSAKANYYKESVAEIDAVKSNPAVRELLVQYEVMTEGVAITDAELRVALVKAKTDAGFHRKLEEILKKMKVTCPPREVDVISRCISPNRLKQVMDIDKLGDCLAVVGKYGENKLEKAMKSFDEQFKVEQLAPLGDEGCERHVKDMMNNFYGPFNPFQNLRVLN